MRIWDVNPGYLNRQSLLGEHRELHGIVSILVNRKKGYSNHPETRRWVGYGWALSMRHRLLADEMALRGYTDRSPVRTRAKKGLWPATWVDSPMRQFAILADKYRDKEQGRIPLPHSARQLWHHHQYSVLARDVGLYRQLNRSVFKMAPDGDFSDLAGLLTRQLRVAPSVDGLSFCLEEMWAHITDGLPLRSGKSIPRSPGRLLGEIQRRASAGQDPYLMASTALSELAAWIPTV